MEEPAPQSGRKSGARTRRRSSGASDASAEEVIDFSTNGAVATAIPSDGAVAKETPSDGDKKA